MVIDNYVEKLYSVRCKGRDDRGETLLSNGISVEVKIMQRRGSDVISSVVRCSYSGTNHRCNVSRDYNQDNGRCPYSFVLPKDFEIRK